jgi:serine/threonine protein kinase
LLQRFISVCQAVAYAHDKGILHRDLKPINIVLGDHGEAVIIDWGLAERVESAGRPDPAAGPAGPSGTPRYMSPEQAAGRSDLVGPATDVYSLGRRYTSC